MQVGNKRMIVIGDRVLIKLENPEERTKVGLYLPQTVIDKESVAGGRIIATGPGVPIPGPTELDEEPWKQTAKQRHYIPMQAHIGDYALYLRKEGVEVRFENEKYIIVPQNAILVLVREGEEDEDEALV
ncbi:MAG: co-chaperone GroES family protein [Candidatus Sumerlaeota bacterium]|nr:co-chaperone GroES family protein [Candidatus Sumerlaeota bacterium]